MKSKEALDNWYNTESPRTKAYEYELHYRLIKKDLEALDIIKKREIDVKDITDTTDDYDLYVAYCEGKGYAEDYICSQDEFKLLREVLVDWYSRYEVNENDN